MVRWKSGTRAAETEKDDPSPVSRPLVLPVPSQRKKDGRADLDQSPKTALLGSSQKCRMVERSGVVGMGRVILKAPTAGGRFFFLSAPL